jgi:hypothetical protein
MANREQYATSLRTNPKIGFLGAPMLLTGLLASSHKVCSLPVIDFHKSIVISIFTTNKKTPKQAVERLHSGLEAWSL